ncbi:hypothetical protein [Nocardia sp. NBC_01388]
MQNFAVNLGTIGYDALSIGQGVVSMLSDITGMAGAGTGASGYPFG